LIIIDHHHHSAVAVLSASRGREEERSDCRLMINLLRWYEVESGSKEKEYRGV
jgi:hypothetical protein